jgi:hypothetical protein
MNKKKKPIYQFQHYDPYANITHFKQNSKLMMSSHHFGFPVMYVSEHHSAQV